MSMFKLGILGAGNAGNQVAQLGFTSKKFDAIAFNTSSSDLENVTAEGLLKIVIGDRNGAGKDRETAIESLYKTCKKLTDRAELVDFIKRNDIIVIASSTGGGSGGAMAMILLNIVKMMANQLNLLSSKRFIAVNILPQNKEGYLSQKNTADYFSDMVNFEDVTFMSYDNNKYSNLPLHEIFQKVNNDIVEDLSVIRGDYVNPTPLESVDSEDLLRVYDEPGRMVVFKADEIKEKDLDATNIQKIIIDNHLKNSSATEIQHDGVASYVASIFNVSERISKEINPYEPITDFIDSKDCKAFPHIHMTEKGESNSIYLIYSGMSRITDRFSKVIERLGEIETEEALKKKDDGFEQLLGTISQREEKKQPKVVATDIEALFGKIRRK